MSTKTLYPIGKRVLLVKDEAPDTSKGGIIIPDKSKEKPLTAHIIAVGQDCEHISPGDEVIYASFAGTEFNVDGQEVIVVDEEDIMLVLREVTPSHNESMESEDDN